MSNRNWWRDPETKTWTTREWKGRWGKIFNDKKTVHHSKQVPCSVCKGKTRFSCAIKNCYVGTIRTKSKKTEYVPCKNEGCYGNETELKNREEMNKLLDQFKAELDQQDQKAKIMEQHYETQKKLLNSFSLAAKDAVIDREWEKFLSRYGGRDAIAGILGEEAVKSLEEINKMVMRVPDAEVLRIFQQYGLLPQED